MTKFSDLTQKEQELALQLRMLSKETKAKIRQAIDLCEQGRDVEARALLEVERSRFDQLSAEAQS